jgi:hypothetical protein
MDSRRRTDKRKNPKADRGNDPSSQNEHVPRQQSTGESTEKEQNSQEHTKQVFRKARKFFRDIHALEIKERTNIWLTGAIVLFTAVLAGVSIWQILTFISSVEDENRAYLAIQQIKSDSLIAGKPLTVRFVLKNVGKTPAYKVTHGYGFAIRETLTRSQLDTVKFIEGASEITVGPETSYPFTVLYYTDAERKNPFIINQRMAENIYQGRTNLFVFGRIEFRDKFEKKRFVDYAGRIDVADSHSAFILSFFNDQN